MSNKECPMMKWKRTMPNQGSLDIGHSTFDIHPSFDPSSPLDIGHSILDIHHFSTSFPWTLAIGHWILDIRPFSSSLDFSLAKAHK